MTTPRQPVLLCGCVAADEIIRCPEALALRACYERAQAAFWAALEIRQGTEADRLGLGKATLRALWALKDHLGMRRAGSPPSIPLREAV